MPAAANPVVWPLDGLTRIFLSDIPPHDVARRCRAGWSLDAARGEFVTCQLGIHADGRIARLTIEPSALRCGRALIAPEAVRIRHADLVPMPLAKWSPAERYDLIPGWYPDPLRDENPWAERAIQFLRPVSVAAHLTLRVSHTATPGLYRGTVVVRDGRTAIERVPIAVRVWPFALPRRPTFHDTEWFYPQCLSLWHRCELWSERYWSLLDLTARDMAEHRQDVITTPSIFGSYYEGVPQPLPLALVDAYRTRRGEYRFDFSRLARWVRLFDQRGFALFELWHFARAGDGSISLPFRYRDEARGRWVEVADWPTDSPRYRALVAAFLSALSAWLDERRLMHRFIAHVFDEPQKESWPHYARLGRFFKEQAPRLRLMDAISSSDLLTRHGAPVDIPVPLTPHLDNDEGYLRRLREGKPVWWYTCCVPLDDTHANRFVSQPLIAPRILSWQAFALGLQGYLHWGYNYWHQSGNDGPYHASRRLLNPYSWAGVKTCFNAS